MNPTLFQPWPLDRWIGSILIVAALIYFRGWHMLFLRVPKRFGPRQVWCFLGGLVVLFVALASPIETYAAYYLQVHMLQHLLLAMVAPPLLWLGDPLLPMLRGLPWPMRMYWVAPWLRMGVVRGIFRFLTRLPVAWLLFVFTMWAWHVPRFYDIALKSDGWHRIEHACFLVTAMAFWFPVVQPYPSRQRFNRWLLIPYLLLADVQNTAFSALFAFSNRVIYPHYGDLLGPLAALEDQAAAGAIMWVPGSLAFLVPMAWIGVGLLFGGSAEPTPVLREKSRIALPVISGSRGPTDLLQTPLLGRFLKWRHARPAMQLLTFALTLAVIVDGFRGPQVAPLNLAGVVPWIHARGLVLLGLLVVGNVFCMSCPFMLPRRLAKRWLPAAWRWPGRLRGKGLAIVLLLVFFWAYEAHALWAKPLWAAAILAAFFIAAFVIDGLFQGAAFCKYACPIGQFQFVQSLVSPFEITVRSPRTCLDCTTKDCIRGNEQGPGCETHLYQPRKKGNLDCTFCLDCIHACPHDNIGILAVPPGADLMRDPQRSGIGRWSRRFDLALLVLVLTFGAFVNAALMTEPIAGLMTPLAQAWGKGWTVAGMMLAAQVAGPVLLLGGLAWLTALVTASAKPAEIFNRFAFAFVPLGFAMWLAHFSFHLGSGWDQIVPALQRGLRDLGLSVGPLAPPETCFANASDSLLYWQILCLDVGLLLSLYVGYRLACGMGRHSRFGVIPFLPWLVLMVGLFLLGQWIILQPMEMRGLGL